MSFIWNFFARCFQREYQFKDDCLMKEQGNVRNKLQPSAVLFCNIQNNSSCLARSRRNSGNACRDASLTPISSPCHLRNWELDPSTVFNQPFDHYEIFPPLYDLFITPSPVPNHTVSFFCFYYFANKTNYLQTRRITCYIIHFTISPQLLL